MTESFRYSSPPQDVHGRIDEKIEDPIRRAGAHAFYSIYSGVLTDIGNRSFGRFRSYWREEAVRTKRAAIEYASKFVERGQTEYLPDFTQFRRNGDAFITYDKLVQLPPEQLRDKIRTEFRNHVSTDRDGVERFLLPRVVEIAENTPFVAKLTDTVASELTEWNPSPEGMMYGLYLIELAAKLHIPGRTSRYFELALDPRTDVVVNKTNLKEFLLRNVAYNGERSEEFDLFWEKNLDDPRLFEEAFIYFREKSIMDGIEHLPKFVKMLRKQKDQAEQEEKFYADNILRDNLVYLIFNHHNEVDGSMPAQDAKALKECLKKLTSEDATWVRESLKAEFGADYIDRMQLT